MFDKQINRIGDTINNFTKNKVDENYEIKWGVETGDKSDKFDENTDVQMIYNKVSTGENYENIIKNSADEVLVEVLQCNNGMLVCVDGLNRVCKELSLIHI